MHALSLLEASGSLCLCLCLSVFPSLSPFLSAGANKLQLTQSKLTIGFSEDVVCGHGEYNHRVSFGPSQLCVSTNSSQQVDLVDACMPQNTKSTVQH